MYWFCGVCVWVCYRSIDCSAQVVMWRVTWNSLHKRDTPLGETDKLTLWTTRIVDKNCAQRRSVAHEAIATVPWVLFFHTMRMREDFYISHLCSSCYHWKLLFQFFRHLDMSLDSEFFSVVLCFYSLYLHLEFSLDFISFSSFYTSFFGLRPICFSNLFFPIYT